MLCLHTGRRRVYSAQLHGVQDGKEAVAEAATRVSGEAQSRRSRARDVQDFFGCGKYPEHLVWWLQSRVGRCPGELYPVLNHRH
jgi:hypothetical protein